MIVPRVFGGSYIPRVAYARKNLTTESCAAFNAETPDVPSVKYHSVAGQCVGGWLSLEWRLPHHIIQRFRSRDARRRDRHVHDAAFVQRRHKLAAELAEGLKDASDELREVSRGIHPTILTEAGLGPALRALARRSR